MESPHPRLDQPPRPQHPEPLLLSGPIYGWWFVLNSGVFCAMARRARRRWPGITRLGVFGIGVVMLDLLDLVLECTFIRVGCSPTPGRSAASPSGAGQTFQFPLYECLQGVSQQ